MDPLLSSAASGMRARMESLEMLSNNIANAGTDGYKGDREFYSVYVSEQAKDAADQGISPLSDTQPVIEKHWTDYSQGILQQTGNALDVALDGPGFFTVSGPGGPLYTRSGSFRLDSKGVLITSDGYPLATTSGGTIRSASSSAFQIDTDGTVHQDGQDLGQLAVVDYADRASVNKQGLNYFFNSDSSQKAAIAKAEVRQGHLEQSNVAQAGAAVRLVDVMRQFESLQKALSIGAEMSKEAIEEVARVTQ